MNADEYPFAPGAGSFFLGDAASRWRSWGPPVLAYGANRSPAALTRKLPGASVAALAGRLREWAVVHSAHVSPYGAVPATLVREPGAELAVHALLVEDLAPLDATEPNYDRVRLRGLELDVDGLGHVGEAEAYLSRHGPLLVAGRPVALGALAQDELRRLVAAGRT